MNRNRRSIFQELYEQSNVLLVRRDEGNFFKLLGKENYFKRGFGFYQAPDQVKLIAAHISAFDLHSFADLLPRGVVGYPEPWLIENGWELTELGWNCYKGSHPLPVKDTVICGVPMALFYKKEVRHDEETAH